MNSARATVLSLTIGCAIGDGKPARPSDQQRAETAKLIDEAGGFEGFKIGRPLDEVVNIGAASSKQYMPDGLVLSVYRKSNISQKIGDVKFTSVALYFGRTSELQMYRFSAQATAAECDSSKEKLTDMFGMADPIDGGTSYRWLGHDLFGTWQHATVRGKSTCSVEFRATKMR